jgi:hypothetical protein
VLSRPIIFNFDVFIVAISFSQIRMPKAFCGAFKRSRLLITISINSMIGLGSYIYHRRPLGTIIDTMSCVNRRKSHSLQRFSRISLLRRMSCGNSTFGAHKQAQMKLTAKRKSIDTRLLLWKVAQWQKCRRI